MKALQRLAAVAALCTALLSGAGVADAPDKVLFVGNSFSFYNNGIHNHYNSLIRANGDWQRGKNRTRLKTLSGGHIHEHVSGLAAYLKEDKRGWDAVVLQGHSNEPVLSSKKARFEAALAEAVDIVRQQDMQPILFMTWGYKGNGQMATDIANAYLAQGKKLEVPVVPVGLAFAAAAKQFPHVDLYVPDVLGVEQQGDTPALTYRRDLKHPSAAGTYLAACVFYASLQGKSPEGNLFTAGLSPDVAQALQALSWELVSKFAQQEGN
ncbi:hypothetical protein DRW07_03530 [Alteromonas sediminis]|uniref:SGNH/GDSL hydrolase family protein n=1 Tax=Alteromonas sediminis TaxID=2259342 RepID=A0A3N5ZE08_9ALTE|nr:DUF4886 domain-containing protein [Alteromonas sediminis]RPJ68488.1 hypothetical protein DRW07_03530 [Alteromonas sediminis]